VNDLHLVASTQNDRGGLKPSFSLGNLRQSNLPRRPRPGSTLTGIAKLPVTVSAGLVMLEFPRSLWSLNMSADKIYEDLWALLHADIVPEMEFPAVAPLLVHYTSLENVEKILRNEEVWLSNPLYMNDLEEVRFGVNEGVDIFSISSDIRDALGSEQRMRLFSDAIYRYYDEYASNHVLDLYVMCFSRHDPNDEDGRLSMWRGYGQNGKGAAIVFDSSKVSVIDDSPLALAPVYYGTQEERRELIRQKAKDVAVFIRNNVFPDSWIYMIAFALFRRLCLFAVFSKHIAFSEEREWRLVYFKDRDERSLLTPYFSYFNGPSGIQPKLKLPTTGIPGVIDETFSLLDIIDSIIIGPSASSPLAKMAIERMLESTGKPSLGLRLKMSRIPFRG
jgi:hypothetical protein